MFIANRWTDYEVIDTGNKRKLERWGNVYLDRPDPQAIWTKRLSPNRWEKADGIYYRSNKGGGSWENKSMPDNWKISYTLLSKKKLCFNIKPFAFKHTGLFPEQAANWEWTNNLIKEANREISVLNLFAYTGGATLACASAGAKVTHVDAAKGMVSYAKENSISSGLSNAPIRWLVDDCEKFVQREIRRGNKYDGIIMDPPSYGRGPKGEIWKMEEMIFGFAKLCKQVLSETPLFFLINSYTTGLAPSTVGYMLKLLFPETKVSADEIGLPVSESSELYLPCGSSGRVEF